MRNTTVLLLFTGLLLIAGLTLWPRGKGWAITDGWVVEYEIEVPAYYGFDFQSKSYVPDCPQRRLEALIQQWSLEHRTPGSNDDEQPVSTVRVGRGMPQKDNLLVHRSLVHIEFAGGSEEQLNELLSLLKAPGAGLPAMASEPRRFSRTWYRYEKWPQLYEAREISIDGRSYSYPSDFAWEDVDMLSRILPPQELQHDEPERFYYRLFSEDFRSHEKISYATAVTPRAGGTLSIRSLGGASFIKADPYADLHIDHIVSGPMAYGLVYPDGRLEFTGTDADHLRELRATLEHYSKQNESDYVLLSEWELTYLLLPRDRFEPGHAAESYVIGAEEKQQLLQKWAAYEAVVNNWLTAHPQCKGRSYGHEMLELRGGRLLTDPDPRLWPRDEPHSSFRVLLFNVPPDLREDLRAALDAVDPQATAFSWQRKDRRVEKRLAAGDQRPPSPDSLSYQVGHGSENR